MEITLDLRDREPPEPLFETLDCIDGLEPGDIVHLRLHREPLMLYPHLAAMNIPWRIERYGTPDWLVCIGPLPETHGS
ncbi:MAG TPA: DUF2249 domain-containing protein [Woeseiaceae bacterium]|nr:DUF2249 domain-containing protein [Woeseiaceae bacterium]